ncbi:MAG: hypothetical protein Q8891_10780 [Bacteroidota bacterium]|nr:hypothetical protein [Bacteroidota bacterium]
MKQSLILSLICIVLFSCNNQPESSSPETSNSAKKDTIAYPFTPKYSLNWQPGDEKNALLVLDCLKKYVAGDIKGCMSYMADSVEFIADRFHFIGSRDSLESFIAALRNASTSVSKNFDTWITTYYPETNETWVTLWYTEVMTDKKGKTDSIYYTDDVMLKNGKIGIYDEKQRQFPFRK